VIIVILLVGWISSVAGLFLEVEINGDVNVLGILMTRGGVKPIETMIVPIGYMNINVTIIMNGYASKKINQKTFSALLPQLIMNALHIHHQSSLMIEFN
jgi:hypothetical protein